MIDNLRDRVISGQSITKAEAVQISALPKTEMFDLLPQLTEYGKRSEETLLTSVQ